ncbi:type IV secretion system protein VirD4, partial [Rhizobium lentis]|nr:type IV secretion system protein VirD4 [Rhizobium lentis]
MDGSTTRKLNTLLFAFLFALMIGLLFASVYASFCRHGISRETINRFDIFSFWYETPLYVGYATPVFLRGLTIAVSTAVITTMVGAIVILKKRNYHGTARWATRQELQRAGYIRRFRNITGPIFGKTVGPRWPGRYLT